MVASAPSPSWQRVMLAVALAYVLALKLLAGAMPAPALLAPGAVICHTAGDAGAPGLPGDTGACDQCCLLRLAGFVAPLLVPLLLVFLAVSRQAAPLRRFWLRDTGEPPDEAWSPVHAARGPPRPA